MKMNIKSAITLYHLHQDYIAYEAEKRADKSLQRLAMDLFIKYSTQIKISDTVRAKEVCGWIAGNYDSLQAMSKAGKIDVNIKDADILSIEKARA